MKYIIVCLLVLCYTADCLEKSSSRRHFPLNVSQRYSQEPALSDADKNSRQIQLDDLYSTLLKDLAAYAHPEVIQSHLDRWDNIKTLEINMKVEQIDRILVTARSMPNLALHTTPIQAQNSELQSSKKAQFNCNSTTDFAAETQKYINAQLCYDKICNHLGIKK